jgi:hypothetical protein
MIQLKTIQSNDASGLRAHKTKPKTLEGSDCAGPTWHRSIDNRETSSLESEWVFRVKDRQETLPHSMACLSMEPDEAELMHMRRLSTNELDRASSWSPMNCCETDGEPSVETVGHTSTAMEHDTHALTSTLYEYVSSVSNRDSVGADVYATDIRLPQILPHVDLPNFEMTRRNSNVTTKWVTQRSASIAIARDVRSNSARLVDADEARQRYERATQRMYNRIIDHRTKHASPASLVTTLGAWKESRQVATIIEDDDIPHLPGTMGTRSHAASATYEHAHEIVPEHDEDVDDAMPGEVFDFEL